MIAETVGVEARGIDQVTDAMGVILGVDVELAQTVAAGCDTGFNRRWSLRITCKQLDHAARVVPLQGRKRAAQYLDAFAHVQVERSGLTLPAGHGGRDASTIRRTPRTPKAARAPKPREEICKSCA